MCNCFSTPRNLLNCLSSLCLWNLCGKGGGCLNCWLASGGAKLCLFSLLKVVAIVVQILLNSQVHEFIVVEINGDECRSHEEVNFNCA